MTIVGHRPHGAFGSLNDLFSGFFGRDIAQFYGSDDLTAAPPREHRGGQGRLPPAAARPGLAKDDLKLNVEDHTSPSAREKKQDELQENARWTRREFGHSSFKRSFRLPENVQVDAIKADHLDGVLT